MMTLQDSNMKFTEEQWLALRRWMHFYVVAATGKCVHLTPELNKAEIELYQLFVRKGGSPAENTNEPVVSHLKLYDPEKYILVPREWAMDTRINLMRLYRESRHPSYSEDFLQALIKVFDEHK